MIRSILKVKTSISNFMSRPSGTTCRALDSFTIAKLYATFFQDIYTPKSVGSILKREGATACALGLIRPDSSCHSYLRETPSSDAHSRTARDRIGTPNSRKNACIMHTTSLSGKCKDGSGSNTDIQTMHIFPDMAHTWHIFLYCCSTLHFTGKL